ncbi:hypothetical protein SDC9_199814 [bioreactor metagenome]|uniref:Uncharacterized protein n=1 Tax=bioreactor metagenome TaxID=1076179 RepID=A0A645IM38_9ZZZZ
MILHCRLNWKLRSLLSRQICTKWSFPRCWVESTIAAMLCSPSTRVKAAQMLKIGPLCWNGCIYAGQNGGDLPPKFWIPPRAKKPASKLSASPSMGLMPTAIYVPKREFTDWCGCLPSILRTAATLLLPRSKSCLKLYKKTQW